MSERQPFWLSCCCLKKIDDVGPQVGGLDPKDGSLWIQHEENDGHQNGAKEPHAWLGRGFPVDGRTCGAMRGGAAALFCKRSAGLQLEIGTNDVAGGNGSGRCSDLEAL